MFWEGRSKESSIETDDIVFTITGLRISVYYEVKVRLENESGHSDWGEYSKAVKTQASAPEPPRDLLEEEILAKSIKLVWNLPITDNGSPVTCKCFYSSP